MVVGTEELEIAMTYQLVGKDFNILTDALAVLLCFSE